MKKNLIQGAAGFLVGIVACLIAWGLYRSLGVSPVMGFVLVVLGLITLGIIGLAIWVRWAGRRKK